MTQSHELESARKAGSRAHLDEVRIVERVRRDLRNFTEAETRVAHAMLSDYPAAGLETVARFAKRAGTSGPTVLRFVSRIGFKTYAEFQEAVRAELRIRLQGPLARYPSEAGTEADHDLFQQMASALCHNIERAEKALVREDMAATIGLLCEPSRAVLCIGGRFTGMIAAYFHHYLRELRSGVRLVRDGGATWADYLLDVNPGDVLVVFDFRRYQRDVYEFAEGAASQRAEIILITDVWNSPIAAVARHVIACPVEVPTAFDSGVGGLAVVEMIIAGVVKHLGDDAKSRIESLELLRKPFHLDT